MVWVHVHSLRPAGRDAPAASCPCPWARGLGFLGEAAWEQGPLFKERQGGGRLSTQRSGPKERKRIGQWHDICEVARLADRFLLQMGQAEGSISPGVWAQGRGAGHSGPHLWGHSLSMPPSPPQLPQVLVRKGLSGCYFLILPSPFFLSPLQKHDGKPRVSVPWPFWEHSVQLPVHIGPAACLWSGSRGSSNKIRGFPSTYVARSWKQGPWPPQLQSLGEHRVPQMLVSTL